MSFLKTPLLFLIFVFSTVSAGAQPQSPNSLLVQSLKGLRAGMREIEEKNAALEYRNQDLRRQLTELSGKLRETQEKNNSGVDGQNIETEDARIQTLRQDLENLRQKTEEFREEQRQRQERLRNLQQQEPEMIDRRESLLADIARLKETVGMLLENENSQWAGQQQDLQKEMVRQESEIQGLRGKVEQLEARESQTVSSLTAGQARQQELAQKTREARAQVKILGQRQAKMMEEINRFESAGVSAADIRHEIESLILRRDVLTGSLALIKGNNSLRKLDLGMIHDEKKQLKEYLRILKQARAALEKKASATLTNPI